MSMKNSSDTIGNRTRDLPSGSAVPLTAECIDVLHTLHVISSNNCHNHSQLDFRLVTVCAPINFHTHVIQTPLNLQTDINTNRHLTSTLSWPNDRSLKLSNPKVMVSNTSYRNKGSEKLYYLNSVKCTVHLQTEFSSSEADSSSANHQFSVLYGIRSVINVRPHVLTVVQSKFHGLVRYDAV